MALRTSTRLLIAASVPGGPGDHRQLLLRSMWKVKETMGRDHSSELLDGKEERVGGSWGGERVGEAGACSCVSFKDRKYWSVCTEEGKRARRRERL